MDSLALLPGPFPLRNLPAVTETDYTPETLFRALLLRYLCNLSNDVTASSLKREKAFETMKRVYGMARAKLIGLEKVTSEY